MASVGLSEAAKLTGRNQTTIHRATKTGRLSFTVGHGIAVPGQLTPQQRAALIARLDTNPTKADWTAYDRELEARLRKLW